MPCWARLSGWYIPPKNSLVLLVIAFLISPFELPKLAFWLLGQAQGFKYAIQDLSMDKKAPSPVMERVFCPYMRLAVPLTS